MSRGLDPDIAAKVENVLKHLNRKHPDTVLFLARRAAAASDAIDAELVAVDRDGVDIAVRQPQGSSTVRLPFTAAINAVPDLKLQLRDILGNARAAAPDEPLTSLEEKIASRKDWRDTPTRRARADRFQSGDRSSRSRPESGACEARDNGGRGVE
jgi:hypothetical protein